MPAHATPQIMHGARAPLARRRLVTHRYARPPAVVSRCSIKRAFTRRPVGMLLLLLLSLPSLLLLLLLGPGSGGAAIPVNAQPDLQLRP